MQKITVVRRSLLLQQKVADHFGEDSAIAEFIKQCKVEKGKVLLERTSIKVPIQGEKGRVAGLSEIRQHDMVVASHRHSFGCIVLVPKDVPTVQVCVHAVDGRVKAVFVIVDEQSIYATKRV